MILCLYIMIEEIKMDIQELINIAKRVPELEQRISTMEGENILLKQELNSISKPQLLNVEKAALILGVTKDYTRKIFNEIGASRSGKRIFITDLQLLEWHRKNRRLSKEEINIKANDYCLDKPLIN